MEMWITLIVIPLFVNELANSLKSNKIALPSNENKIIAYKELLGMHVRKLKNNNISKLEISKRCSQIVEITNTMYELYLQNCKYESDMVNKLFNVQNQCIIMVESKKSNDINTAAISELEQAIRKFYNTMIENYKKYNKSGSIGTQGSAMVLLLLIIIGTVSGIWCTYNGSLENDYIAFAAIGFIVLLYWIAIVNIINLIGYMIKKVKGR